MRYLTNAFSINMLDPEDGARDLAFVPIAEQTARNLLANEPYTPAIGHEQTAEAVALRFGLDANEIHDRLTLTLTPDDSLLVVQYHGPRLPEGTTELPEGVTLRFWQVYDFAGAINS